MKAWLENVSFILVGPTEPGNIGAAARAIKNMGFRRLELVAPVPYQTEEARAMACQAKDILDQARVFRSFKTAIAGKSLIVGTTRRLGSRRGIIMDVGEAVRRIAGVAVSNKVAILFGNEHNGLTNQELEECGLILTISSDPAFPSLNLAQSVMIVAYELSRVGSKARPLPLVENRDVQRLFQRLPLTLKSLGYARVGDKDLRAEIARNLKRLIARSGLTKWELNMLLGLSTQVENRLGPKAVRRPRPKVPRA
jgi:TrmH family RNA methyltransferase